MRRKGKMREGGKEGGRYEGGKGQMREGVMGREGG